MSDNFQDKDYKDYFCSLENQILSEREKPHTTRKIPTVQKKHSRKYKVIRIKPSAVLSVVMALAIIGIAIFGIAKTVNANKQSKNNTVSEADSVVTVKKDNLAKYAKFTDNTLVLGDEIDAKSVIIIDTKSNKVIAEKSSDLKAYPSSTTKILTLLVAVENITDFNDTFTMSLDITDPLYVKEASVAGFLPDETITMTDLLYGTILPSGADAAMGLAIKISGSEEAFVSLMNKKVKELGLTGTHFTNVSGLYSDDHYTTAHDMAVILHTAMLNEKCREILSTYQYTTSVTPKHPEGILLSSTLFSNMYGTEPETATVKGGKTGFVNESGYCIASFGNNNTTGNEYIIVTLGSSSRWPAFYSQIELYKKYAK